VEGYAMKITMKIQLLTPLNGSVSEPLQRHHWPGGERKQGAFAPSYRWDDLRASFSDRSFPKPVSFSWEASTRDREGLRYDFILSRSPSFSDSFVLGDLLEPKVGVFHLHIGTRYYWKVIAKRCGQVVGGSPVWSFVTNRTAPRWIRIPGMTNVRDVGGWPIDGNRMVRQGMIYRSSEMNNHLQITEGGKGILLDDLGIRTDLDLRGVYEEAQPVFHAGKVRYVNIPIYPYGHIVEEPWKEGYCRIFKFFADASNYPILCHCWGGADRTGTVAFLLHGLLGLNEENMARDYELTSLSIWGERSRLSDEFRGLLHALDGFGNGSETIREKVENYLLSIGVTPEEVSRIRAHLIAVCEEESELAGKESESKERPGLPDVGLQGT